jgi:hypothetical protein
VLVFYDILIYSQTMKGHVTHQSTVLQILEDNHLTVNRAMCTFASSHVEYLGHIISGLGVATDPSKIDVVQN